MGLNQEIKVEFEPDPISLSATMIGLVEAYFTITEAAGFGDREMYERIETVSLELLKRQVDNHRDRPLAFEQSTQILASVGLSVAMALKQQAYEHGRRQIAEGN
jgi:hypothetical protein